jgi:transposase
MLIRLIISPADEHRSGANQMRQQLSFREHFRRGNAGASANLLRSRATNADPWVIGLRRRRPSLVVAVALANKTARIAWAVMRREESYRPRVAAAAA